jgi:autotransporter-associated beta strand protein/T5SS/PEP-CTERM-associated repeat protein
MIALLEFTKKTIALRQRHNTHAAFAAIIFGLIGCTHALGQSVTVYGTASGESAAYTPGTIAADATARLNDGATVSGTNGIAINGELQFNQSTGTLTLSNVISGNGTLSLTNSGTLRLIGTTQTINSRGYIPLNMTINANSGVLTGSGAAQATQNTIFQLGSSGTGTLNIAGGLVTGTSWHIGVGSGGVGTVNVSSGTFAPRGGLLIGGTVGGTGGRGTLNITGGLVGDTAFIATALAGASSIASGTGSTGLMTITNGTFASNSQLNIGSVGSGTVTLNSGGYLKAGETILGKGSAARGTLNLLSGTALGMSTVVVGGTGTGVLTVNGSLYQTRNSTIGESVGSNGTVTVTSGTWLNNASGIGNEIQGYLAVGGSGTGSLTINNGGYVSVSGTFSRGANGTFALNQGGTLQIGSADGNNNPFTTASGTSGVLVGDLNYAGTLKFAQNRNGIGGSVISTHAGNLSGTGDLVKTGTGTLNLTGSNSYTGGTTIEQGRISLANANSIGTTGTISFSTSGTVAPGALQATANNSADYSSRFSNAANQRYAVDSNGETLTLASNLTSSGGSFTKYGAGSVTLTGANTFTSGSAAAGTLIGTASSLSTSGTFGVATGAELRFNQASSGTWAGALAGSGTFAKVGAGALTLTGSTSNTTGSLVVSEGSVIGTTNSIRRAVTNNAQVTFNQSVSGTYARVLSGTGVLVKDGVGTLSLTGNNTSTGDVTLADGTLSLGSANALGSSGTINFDGGTLQSTANNTTDYSSRFSNAANQEYRIDTNGRAVTLASALTSSGGSFTKVGSGTATLTGANSYSGGTTISAGRLVGTTTSLQRNIVNNADVAFSQSTNGTYSGVMSGNGSLTKLGSGTVTLTGSNSYSGGTTITTGRLIGTTSSIRGDINNAAAVSFDQSTNGTYSGALSGTGSLTKLGAGAVTLEGNNSYSGSTIIDNGDLKVNGSIANSAVTINSNGSLSGSGTVGGISGAGSINPGNSPGILTASWIDPSDGMFLNFEITGIKPEYSLASGSVNDVLRLTSASPFVAAMNSGNQINVYFNMASFDMTQAHLGGIYTDEQADFASMVSGASFNYYVQDNAGTINYNGVLFSALSSAVTVSTVLDTANFAGGTVNGRVMQFTIVPETSSALLAACGTLFLLRRRRKA